MIGALPLAPPPFRTQLAIIVIMSSVGLVTGFFLKHLNSVLKVRHNARGRACDSSRKMMASFATGWCRLISCVFAYDRRSHPLSRSSPRACSLSSFLASLSTPSQRSLRAWCALRPYNITMKPIRSSCTHTQVGVGVALYSRPMAPSLRDDYQMLPFDTDEGVAAAPSADEPPSSRRGE